MLPLLRMLEYNNLSLRDAEAAGFRELAAAAQRCQRCADTVVCVGWLKRSRHGRAPLCLNAGYFEWLKERSRAH